MPRDIIQKDEFIDSIHKQVANMIPVFTSRKNNLQAMFDTLIAFRDDVDTPAEYVAVLQTNINQGISLIRSMLDGIT